MPWLCIHIEILFLLTGYMSHVVLKQVLRKLHCKSVEVIETNSSKRQGRYSCETCRFSSWYLRYQRSLRYHRVPKVRLGCPQNGTKGFYHHSFKHLFLWFDCKSCFSMTQLFVMLFRFHTPLNSCRGRDTFMVPWFHPSRQKIDSFHIALLYNSKDTVCLLTQWGSAIRSSIYRIPVCTWVYQTLKTKSWSKLVKVSRTWSPGQTGHKWSSDQLQFPAMSS